MNAANAITLIRIILVPIIATCFFYQFSYWRECAWALFTIAAVSDIFDGWMARRSQEVTLLGTVLDPIADKLLIITSLFLLVWNGDLSVPFSIVAMILIWREILISGLREGVGSKKIKIPVSVLAKRKTFLQLCSVGGLILGEQYYLVTASKVVLIIAAILSLITAYNYIKSVSQQLSWTSGDLQKG